MEMFKIYDNNGNCYLIEAIDMEYLQRAITNIARDKNNEWLDVVLNQEPVAVKASSIQRIEPTDLDASEYTTI